MSGAVVPDLASPPVLRAEADRFCPECGQSLEVWRIGLSPRRTAHPWWPAVLVAVGLYLTVAFGMRAWGAHHPVDNVEGPRHLAAAATAGVGETSPGIASARTLAIRAPDPWGDLARIEQRVRELTQDRLAMRELAVAAVGLLAVVVGLGATARRSLLHGAGGRGRGEGPASRGQIWDPALGIWELAETVALSLFRLLFLAFCYSAASQLIQGESPSGALVVESIDRTIGVVVAALQSL